MKVKVYLFFALFLGLCINLHAQCNELMFSEYVEGSGSRKVLEIYNPTPNTIDLTDYSIRLYSNGNTTTSGVEDLTGSIAGYSTFVIKNSTETTITADLSLGGGIVNFNGNDALELVKNGTVVDVLGTVGNASNYGLNVTLVRKSTIQSPTTSYDANEWNIEAQNDISNLNTHTSDCQATMIGFSVSTDGITENGTTYTITVTSNTTGAHTADLAISGGSAPVADYTFTPITASFANSTTFTTTVTINDNGNSDGTRDIIFELSNPTNGSILATSNLTLSIWDDEVQILDAGDLIIVGFDTWIASGGADMITLTNLVDLYPGASFTLGNTVFEPKAAAYERTNRWYNGNGNFEFVPAFVTVTYTGANNLPKGSVICLTLDNIGSVVAVDVDGVSSNDFTEDGGSFVQFSSVSPDAIFLLQGTVTNNLTDNDGDLYATFEGNVLGAIQTRGTFSNFDVAGNANGSRISRIHPDILCYAISTGGTASAFYGYYDPSELHTGSREALIAEILDYNTTWTTGSGAATEDVNDLIICNNPFTVTSSAAYTSWTGNQNNNWFHCGNWDNFTVPDESTNVVIPVTAINNGAVDATAEYSDDFLDTAKCNNLTITGATLSVENNTDILEVHGDLILNSTGALDLNDGIAANTDGQLLLYGNWDNQLTDAAFDEGNSQVFFLGTNNQTLNTTNNSADKFANVVIDKSSGTLTNHSSEIEILESFSFTNGIVHTSTTETLLFNKDATALNASDASHVNGPVMRETDDAASSSFTFPTGKSGRLGQIGIETRFGMGEYYEAEYFAAGYGDYTVNINELHHVSSIEYWELDESVGGSGEEVKVTLHWGAHSDVVTPSNLRVGHWEQPANVQWEREGDAPVITGNASSGTITTDVYVTSFSPFTLASRVVEASLPVELTNFVAKRQESSAFLNWKVENEEQGTRYTLERSKDGIQFYPIYETTSASASFSTDYHYFDEMPVRATNYYRLHIQEIDGADYYSAIQSVDFGISTTQTTIYPNPAKNDINIEFGDYIPETATIEIMNALGQTVLSQTLTLPGYKTTINTQQLGAGHYILRIKSDDGTQYLSKRITIIR